MVDSVTLALNEPSAANLLDDAGQATGSLLGSLVIVARFRGVQLSKEQLIRDHQLRANDASVKETLSIAHASGLRASATRLHWGDLFNMGTALPAIVLLRNGAAMVLTRTEAKLPGWPPVVVLRDPNGNEETPLLLDEARFTAAWAGEVILVKRDYRLRDEDRPFGMGWVAFGILLLFETAFGHLRRYLVLFVTTRVDVKIWTHMFNKILNLPIEFFER